MINCEHIHKVDDGRRPRVVKVRGRIVHCVIYADLKKQIVVAYKKPYEIDKEKGELKTHVVRGPVEVEYVK